MDDLESITFIYIIRPGEATYYRDRVKENKNKNKKVTETGFVFNNTELPMSPEPSALGEILVKNSDIPDMPDTTKY